MSEVQPGTEPVAEPFKLFDPSTGDLPSSDNNRLLTAPDVQRLIQDEIKDQLSSFQTELLQALQSASAGQSERADKRAANNTACGGGTAAASGPRTTKQSVGDALGLSDGAGLSGSGDKEADWDSQKKQEKSLHCS